MNTRQLTSLLLMFSSSMTAYSQPISQSGSGSLPFQGYGFEYIATWDSNINDIFFLPTIVTGSNSLEFFGRFSTTDQFTEVSDIGFSAVVEVRYVSIETGIEGLPSFALSGYGQTSSAPGLFANGFQAGGIRFSNFIRSVEVAVTDLEGQSIIGISGVATSFKYRIEASFEGGNFLNPSPEPSCASFACMIPGRDVVQLGSFAYFSVQAIPEPSTWLLLSCGLAALVGVTRRRLHSTPLVAARLGAA